MKDGSRSRVTRVPWTAPNTAQKSSPPAIAAHHGQLAVSGCTSWTVIAAPQAPTNPTERSISPSTRTKASAIARTMNTALCWKRFTRLVGDRKTWLGLMISKTAMITTIATITGRTPLSPARMRTPQALRYSPRV